MANSIEEIAEAEIAQKFAEIGYIPHANFNFSLKVSKLITNQEAQAVVLQFKETAETEIRSEIKPELAKYDLVFTDGQQIIHEMNLFQNGEKYNAKLNCVELSINYWSDEALFMYNK